MDISNDNTEKHPRFPSGEWEGFYLNYSSEKHQMFFSLNFRNGHITGAGSDDVGAFSWKGSYDKNALTCQMTKYYPTHEVHYKGHADENGIWGTWTIGYYMKDGFHIWPKKNEKSEEAEAVVSESVTITCY